MYLIKDQLKKETLTKLQGELEQKLGQEDNLDNACQQIANLFYNYFRKSLVLARVYVSLPYESLPAKNQAFIDTIASVSPETPVLSLLGTRGINSEGSEHIELIGLLSISCKHSNIRMLANLLANTRLLMPIC